MKYSIQPEESTRLKRFSVSNFRVRDLVRARIGGSCQPRTLSSHEDLAVGQARFDLRREQPACVGRAGQNSPRHLRSRDGSGLRCEWDAHQLNGVGSILFFREFDCRCVSPSLIRDSSRLSSQYGIRRNSLRGLQRTGKGEESRVCRIAGSMNHERRFLRGYGGYVDRDLEWKISGW